MQQIVPDITFTLMLLVLAAGSWGAFPQTINYQGYLRNTDDTSVNNTVSVPRVAGVYNNSKGNSRISEPCVSGISINAQYAMQ